MLAASPLSHLSNGPNHQQQRNAFDPMSTQEAVNESTYFPSSTCRKRSRDEASINLEPDVPPSTSVDGLQTDWVYGEGMVLIKPNAGYIADASSQSGTWLEEKTEMDKEVTNGRETERPRLRNHKSLRMDHEACDTAPTATLISDASGSLGKSHITASGPVVDDFTLHLGIGWRRISDDEHIQAAARGWARFIENHYPLTKVCVVLESKGLQSYLVEAAEGFYLLAEDLRQARLVSQNVEGALQNLQMSPPRFDGSNAMVAELPRLVESQCGNGSPDTDMCID